MSAAFPARKPVRCLVIQLTRLGDTLQSLMALRAAKQLYPELEIHFLARERFAEAAKRVPWIEEVVTFPSDRILGPVLSGEHDEAEGIASLARWVAPLAREPWDFIINWSYSESSSYLTGILPGRIKLGYTRRSDTSFHCADGWSHYIQAIVQGGVDQNIHLTDILTTQILTALQIHIGEPANEGNAPVTSKSFFSLSIAELESSWAGRSDTSRKWAAFQLGAGTAAKTWSPERFAAVATQILRRHPEYNLVLLGGREDQARAKQFMAALALRPGDERRVVSLVGQTEFDLWASVVSRCQWVLACDTAVIHLASVLGTRVLNLSIGPVRWAETGPYGNGHYIVATSKPCAACDAVRTGAAQLPSEHSCATDLSPEAVYATWAYASSEWSHRRNHGLEKHFSDLGWSAHLAATRVLRSKIRPTQDGGGVVYELLVPGRMELNDWTSAVMGHIARSWYCGWVPPVGQELLRERIAPQLIQRLRALDESSIVLQKICEEGSHTALALKKRSVRLRSDKVMRVQDRDEIQGLGQRLTELDFLVDRLGKADFPLQGFAQMSRVLMHNLAGEQLSTLGQETADSYQQIKDGVGILREWVRHTLGLARPVAVADSEQSDPKDRGAKSDKETSV